jgi:hypothetical protein
LTVLIADVRTLWEKLKREENRILRRNKMSGLDETISDVGYILDALVLLRNIMDAGDCNVCAHKDCEYVPKPGQMVRYNCPFYKAEEEEV